MITYAPNLIKRKLRTLGLTIGDDKTPNEFSNDILTVFETHSNMCNEQEVVTIKRLSVYSQNPVPPRFYRIPSMDSRLPNFCSEELDDFHVRAF